MSYDIQQTARKVTVRGIGSRTHECQEFVRLDLYILGQIDGKSIIAHLKQDVHLVDDLRANLLIEKGIIGPDFWLLQGL